MKNLLQIIILSVIMGVIFSACGKQMSITKRKYTKGYYVSHSHKRPEIKTEQIASAAKPVNAEHLSFIKTDNIKVTNPEKEIQLTASVAKPTEIQSAKIQKPNGNLPVKYTKKFFKAKPLEKLLPGTLYTTELKKKLTAASDQEALSLLWIVIVVLLILYLIGLLAGGWGLGWAIHILVIVAVVLLILWLLRVL